MLIWLAPTVDCRLEDEGQWVFLKTLPPAKLA
jgi:hypothetical protein